jgi:hypothetical protein
MEEAGSEAVDPSAFKGVTEAQVAELKNAGRELAKAAQSLDARITDLASRIESLGDVEMAEVETVAAPVETASELEARTDASVFVIRIEPLRELAMAAMAETALRDLPSVVQVVSVERAENWANFTLEVKSDADLVEEMKLVMPVYFKVTESSPGRISIALAWAWGEPDAQG